MGLPYQHLCELPATFSRVRNPPMAARNVREKLRRDTDHDAALSPLLNLDSVPDRAAHVCRNNSDSVFGFPRPIKADLNFFNSSQTLGDCLINNWQEGLNFIFAIDNFHDYRQIA